MKSKGERAEREAQRYLERQGLKVVIRNYSCRRGEIDLIMRDGELLVFVEVRLRSHPGYGGGAASVDSPKRRRLTAAALSYLQGHARPSQPCRFDVVAIDGKGQISWISNAFEATE